MTTYVVQQLNSKGVVSLASGPLTSRREAEEHLRTAATRHPTLRYRIVALQPLTGWVPGWRQS